MITVKRRIFAGTVCEQEIYNIADCPPKEFRSAAPRLRFRDEEERKTHRDEIARRRHTRLINENFGPDSLYSTLTFDDAHEVHMWSEARRVRKNFYRRLKRAFPDAVIRIYMGRGKNTDRIHFHMLSKGIPAAVIEEKWGNGSVSRIVPLREHNYYNGIDHGKDYTGLSNYLFDHWTEEQGGQRCLASANHRQPDKETPTVAKRRYSLKKPPRAPQGYKLVESRGTRYGYLYFKYVLEAPKKRRGRPKKQAEN